MTHAVRYCIPFSRREASQPDAALNVQQIELNASLEEALITYAAADPVIVGPEAAEQGG